MKISISTWVINIIGALASAGALGLALNSPALPKNSTAFLVAFVVVMFLTALANALKPSILPSANAKAVLKEADENTPAEGTPMSKAVIAAKSVVIKSAGVLFFAIVFAGCALFTKIVPMFTPAAAALTTCLNDYVDAVPANPLTLTAASLACAATVEQTVVAIQNELAIPAASADAGATSAATIVPRPWVFPVSRREKLAAILATAQVAK